MYNSVILCYLVNILYEVNKKLLLWEIFLHADELEIVGIFPCEEVEVRFILVGKNVGQ